MKIEQNVHNPTRVDISYSEEAKQAKLLNVKKYGKYLGPIMAFLGYAREYKIEDGQGKTRTYYLNKRSIGVSYERTKGREITDNKVKDVAFEEFDLPNKRKEFLYEEFGPKVNVKTSLKNLNAYYGSIELNALILKYSKDRSTSIDILNQLRVAFEPLYGIKLPAIAADNSIARFQHPFRLSKEATIMQEIVEILKKLESHDPHLQEQGVSDVKELATRLEVFKQDLVDSRQ